MKVHKNLLTAYVSSGQSLTRTASLPSRTLCSACGWARTTTTSGYRNLISLEGGPRLLGFNGSNLYLFNGAAGETAAPSSPGANTWFFWYFRSVGDTAATFNAGWATPGSAFVRWNYGGTPSGETPTILYLGNDSYSEPITGKIAALKIWDASLINDELDLEFLTVQPARKANLHIWSPLLVNSSDYSGNGRNWTETGSPSWGDGPPIGWGTSALLVGAAVSGGATVSANPALATSTIPIPSLQASSILGHPQMSYCKCRHGMIRIYGPSAHSRLLPV